MTRPRSAAVLLGCLVLSVTPAMASSLNGDANGDGIISAADIFHAIRYLFVSGPPPAGPFDPNGDESVGVADIFYLINHLFAGGSPPIALISITTEPSRQVNAVADRQGTSITVTRADGTVFTLSIPPGALSESVSLTLMPVSSATGLPLSGGSLAALHMQPDGLQFAIPATLEITLPQPFDAQQLFGFAYQKNGSFVHLVPMTAVGGVVTMNIAHFTGQGIASSTTGDCSTLPVYGLKPREVAQQRIACVLRRAGGVAKLSSGDVGEIEDALDDWFRSSIAPALVTARDCWSLSSCTKPRALLIPAIGEFIEWIRTVDALGDIVSQALDPLEAEGRALSAQLVAAAIQSTETDCKSTSDPTTKWNDVGYLLWIQRWIDTVGWSELGPLMATAGQAFTACELDGYSLQNGTFEVGSFAGWQADGAYHSYFHEVWYASLADVRVIHNLGPLTAPEGSSMAMVATGLLLSCCDEDGRFVNFGDDRYSRIYQQFTVPPIPMYLKFRYDVVTEEPETASYKDGDTDSICHWLDVVEVSLISGAARAEIVRPALETVRTALVPGLHMADPEASTYHSGWKDVAFDLSPFRGQQVVLEIRSTEMCDTLWDTAILIDNIRIE